MQQVTRSINAFGKQTHLPTRLSLSFTSLTMRKIMIDMQEAVILTRISGSESGGVIKLHFVEMKEDDVVVV